EIVRRFGALPFRKCVEPAERLAGKGFPVSWRLAESMAGLDKKPAADRLFREVFAQRLLAVDELWRRPDLAWTLGQLRARGADAFYTGEIAAEIVKAVKEGGGVMTLQDLKSYAVSERAP